jgi:hypothetical protein
VAGKNPALNKDKIMQEEERCCGTGTCLINADGLCWCGQQWDGEKMSRPANEPENLATANPVTPPEDHS